MNTSWWAPRGNASAISLARFGAMKYNASSVESRLLGLGAVLRDLRDFGILLQEMPLGCNECGIRILSRSVSVAAAWHGLDGKRWSGSFQDRTVNAVAAAT